MSTVRGHLTSLVHVPPATRDPRAALRMAVGVAVPSVALLLIGHPNLTMYAVFGAFTGMYGRDEPHQLRVRHQAQASVLLISGVTIGVLLSEIAVSSWTLVAVESAFAFAAATYAKWAQLRPAGPFFGLFALGACASTPPLVDPLGAVGVAVVAAAVSLAIGFVGWIRMRARSAGMRRRHAKRTDATEPAIFLIAVLLAGSLSVLIGFGHPIWAMAAAAVPLSVTGAGNRVQRGMHRVVGTLAGVGVTALILLPFGVPPTLVLVLLLIGLQFPTELFMTRNYALALVFFTPLILIMTQLAHPTPPERMLLERGLETLLASIHR